MVYLTVQEVYDVLKERIEIVHQALSKNSNFQLTQKLRKSLEDAEAGMQKYADDIDSGYFGEKEGQADHILCELYFTKLCPDKKGY